jgi:hypothetical protein
MIKRILLILAIIIACPLPQYPSPPVGAAMLHGIVGQSSTASVATDSCTGGTGLLFSWHFENTDVTAGGVAGGVNNGCSSGDTTAAAQSSAALNTDLYKDGAKAGDFPTSGDYFTFDISSEDIVNSAAGTLDFWIYIQAQVTGNSIWYARNSTFDANNNISIQMYDAGSNPQIRLIHKAGGTSRVAATAISGGFPTGAWYRVIAKWDTTSHSGNYSQICADTTTGTSNCGNNTSALGTWAGTLNQMRIGNDQSGATDFHIETMKIHGSWQ